MAYPLKTSASIAQKIAKARIPLPYCKADKSGGRAFYLLRHAIKRRGIGARSDNAVYAKNKKHRDYHAKNSAHFEKRKRKQHAGRKRGNESGDYEQAV